MTIFGLPTVTFVAMFGWIPFWWVIAAVALYRMRQHDEQKRSTTSTED